MRKIILFTIFLINYSSFSQIENVQGEAPKIDETVTTELPVATNNPILGDTSVPVSADITEPAKTTTPVEISASVSTPSLENGSNSICKYLVNGTNKYGVEKVTKPSLIYLNEYAGNIDRIYFSLSKKNLDTFLTIDFIIKDDEDLLDKKKCFNGRSYIRIGLKNGLKVTLYHIDDEECLQIDETEDGAKKKRARFSGNFKILVGNVEALKNSTITSMEIKFAKSVEEYAIQNNIFLESDNANFEPESYFIKYLGCLD